MIADAKHGVPIWRFLTTASRSDVSELPTLLEKVRPAPSRGFGQRT